MISKEVNRFAFRIPESLSRATLYVGTVLAAAGMGALIALHDALSSLRVLVGLPIILAWLRYPYALLLCWALIDPFIGSNVPIFNGNNFDTALTIPTLLLMTTMPIGETFKRLPALALFLAFLFWVLLGIRGSPLDQGSFLKQWTLFVDYVAVGVLTINILSTPQRMSRFINVLLIAPVVIALYGIYGYLTHQNTIITGTGPARITSIFSDAPSLALLLSNVIPLALYRVFTARRAGRLIAFMALCALLAALGLTFARGAIIGVALCLVIMVLLLPSRRMKLAVLGLAALVTLVVTVGNVPLFARFFGIDLATVNGRTYLWNALLENYDPGQLLGHGLDASNALLAGLASSGNAQIAGAVATSPSNLYVGTLYDQGMVGLALLLLTFVALAVRLIRGMRRTTGEHRALFVVALLTLVNVLVQSVEVNDVLAQSIGVYFWMIVALPFALHWSRSSEPGETTDESLEQATLSRPWASIPARAGSAAQVESLTRTRRMGGP